MKQTKLEENRLFGGLDDSMDSWKEEYWLITADPAKNPFDFHHHWVKPIDKDDFPLDKLYLHDRQAAEKILNWWHDFLERKSPDRRQAI